VCSFGGFLNFYRLYSLKINTRKFYLLNTIMLETMRVFQCRMLRRKREPNMEK